MSSPNPLHLISWLISLPLHLSALPRRIVTGLHTNPTLTEPARNVSLLEVFFTPTRWLATLPTPRYWPSHSASTAQRRYPVRARAPPERFCSCYSRDLPACSCDQTSD